MVFKLGIWWSGISRYRIVASSTACYQLKNQLFVKRSQYIWIENPLHKRSEKACMCFNTRRASTRDYMVSIVTVKIKHAYCKELIKKVLQTEASPLTGVDFACLESYLSKIHKRAKSTPVKCDSFTCFYHLSHQIHKIEVTLEYTIDN